MRLKHYFFILFGSIILNTACDKQAMVKNNVANYDTIEQLLIEANTLPYNSSQRMSLVDSTYAILKNQTTDTLKNRTAVKISSAYWYLRNYEGYNAVSRNLLQWGIKINDTAAKARAYGNISAYFDTKDIIDSAYYYAYNANKLYKAVGDDYRVGRSYIKMGKAQIDKGDLVGAEASMVEAARYFIQLDNVEYLSFVYNNLGVINLNLGNTDKALVDQEKALVFKRRLKNNELSILTSMQNIGKTYWEIGNFQMAKNYYKEILATENLVEKSPETFANAISALHEIQLQEGDLTNFPTAFYKVLAVCESANFTDGVVSTYLDLATYYKAINELDSAKIYAVKANSLSKKAGFDSELLKGLLLMSQVTETAEALKYANQYISLTDSIKNEERKFRNQFARIRFDTDQLEEENKVFEREKEIYAMIAFGVFALGILIYLVKRQQNLRKQLAFEQRQKLANEEIYNLMLSQQLKLNEGKLIERQRFSKELHDGILGKLFGVRLSLDSLNVKGDEKSSAKMKNLYVDELKSIEHEVRQISHDLSSELFASDLGFSEIMEDLIISQCELHGLEYDFENEQGIGWEKVPSFIKMNLYRILQEALQNINKYASATAVKVEFSKANSGIRMLIEDNGKGFNVARNRGGIGLKNINSRSNDINGNCIIESAIGKGTKVIIEFAVLPTNQKEEV